MAGGGTGKERGERSTQLQEAPGSDICHWGCRSHQGGLGISRDRPGQTPPPGARRLITRGLRGHIKQTTIIMGPWPLLGKTDSSFSGERH